MVTLAFAGVQLIPDGSFLIHIALILLMIWILNRTLFKPINRILEQRAKNTGGRSTEADEIRLKAANKQKEYETSLREARSESYNYVETQRNEALAEMKGRVNSVKEETAKKVSEEKATLDTEVSTAQKTLESNAKAIAEQITSNILKG